MRCKQIRSSVGLVFALVLGSAMVGSGCSDNGTHDGGQGGSNTGGAGGKGGSTGGGGSGGKGGTVGSGGVGGKGGSSGSGGSSRADAGRDSAGTGGRRTDGAVDVPIVTGGAGGSLDGGLDAGSGIDSGSPDSAPASNLHLYVGCADSTGTIQVYNLNGATAALSPVSTFLAGGANSNSELNDAADRMYVAHTIGSEAKVSTFTRNTATGALTLLGSPVAVPYAPPGAGGVDGGVDGGSASAVDASAAPTNAGPQTLTFDRARHFLAVPNYFSGYVYVYGMAADGSVGALVASHSAGNNAHHAIFTNNNKFLLVPYLGSNLIESYAFDATTGAIAVAGNTTLPTASSGPRHLALHANGTWLYSINETAGGASSPSGNIDFFTVDQSTGEVTPVSTFTVPLPAGYAGLKNGAEIEISPSGNLLFVSMRLDNVAEGSLVSYQIDPESGALTLVEQEGSHGITPRQFSLTKDGTLLVVGNQNSNTIAVFRVDPSTGDMSFVSTRDVCASPRFAKMAAVK